jgi:hypothetical protein
MRTFPTILPLALIILALALFLSGCVSDYSHLAACSEDLSMYNWCDIAKEHEAFIEEQNNKWVDPAHMDFPDPPEEPWMQGTSGPSLSDLLPGFVK